MRAVHQFSGTPRFVIERTLGEGGMGVVHLAYDSEQKRQVALKTLARVDPGNLYRFKKEFRALSGVSHRNLVVLHELISEGDVWFFTMEYVQGVDFLAFVCDESLRAREQSATESLEALISTRASRPSDAERPAIVRSPVRSAECLRSSLGQLALGISALHTAGKLHKDVKPSNVLVTEEGRVVLLDFGMIDDQGERIDVTIESKVFGTPAYMSPEQAAGQSTQAASDWYAFGVMLFEALTGSLPFDGSVFDILRRKQEEEAPRPSRLVSDVPSDLDDLCVRLLARDPALRPAGAEILALLDASTLDPQQAQPRQHSPFVGRARELQQLRAAFDASRSAQPVVVLLAGKLGIGKSALVRHFVEQLLTQRQAVVLSGRCYERESLPFKAVDSVIDALCRYMTHLPDRDAASLLPRNVQALARLFPVLRQVKVIENARFRQQEVPDLQELRRRGFGALKELFARISDQRPIVLCIDDAHFSDDDSALLLDHLLRPPDAPALLLICGHRNDDVPAGPVLDQVRRLGADIDVRTVDLGPLPESDAAALVQSELLAQGGALSAASAQEIVADAAGNPLFLSELVLAWQRDARAQPRSSGERLTLEQVVRERVALLPLAGRQLLELVAVAGRPIEQGLLLSAADSSTRDLSHVDALRAARLLRTHGSRERDMVECYHERVRQAVLGALSSVQLREYHLRLGNVIEASQRFAPDTLANHFLQSGELLRASQYSLVAARQAADALAFDRAAEHYSRVCQLDVIDPSERAQIEASLGEVLANAGRSAEAAQAYLRAAAGAQGELSFEHERMAAEHFLRSGHVEEGQAVLQRVLARFDLSLPKTPRRALVSLVVRRTRLLLRGLRHDERPVQELSYQQLARIDTCWTAAVGLGLIDFVRGGDFQTRHLLLALEAGEPYRLARALALEAGYVAAEGGKGRTRVSEIIALAEEILARHDHPHALALTRLAGAMGAWHLGHFRESVPLCAEAERICRERCKGVAWEIAASHIFHAAALYYLGQWQALAEQSPKQLREAIERGDRFAASDLHTGVHVVPHLANDDEATARARLADEKARWTSAGFHLQHWNQLFAEVFIELYAGHGERAHVCVEQTWPALRRSLVLQVEVIGIEALYLRACSALGAIAEKPELAAALLRDVERDAQSIAKAKRPWSNPIAQLLLGLSQRLRRRDQLAATSLRVAADGFAAAEMAMHAAAARYRLGELIGGEEGTALCTEAFAALSAQGVKRPDRMLQVLAPG